MAIGQNVETSLPAKDGTSERLCPSERPRPEENATRRSFDWFAFEAGDLLQQINRCKQERAYLREAESSELLKDLRLVRQTYGAIWMACVKG